jgi:flagellar hook-basal body complex protein FliE
MITSAIESAGPGFLPPTWASPTSPTSPSSFDALLTSAVQHVDHAVQAANTSVADFALGNDLPPHQVMLALEQARMSLQFALQVRSRLVEGYQELMRMQL